MSVAFRRESDEEHKEPKFELPIPVGPNFVTPRGLRLIEQEVARLEAEIAEPTSADHLEPLKRDLRYWHTRASTAQVIERPAGEEAAIGSRVTVRMKGVERRFEIVGHDEADPASGRIAFAAPIAQALIGAAAGDRADFNGVTDAIEIVEVGIAEGSFEL